MHRHVSCRVALFHITPPLDRVSRPPAEGNLHPTLRPRQQGQRISRAVRATPAAVPHSPCFLCVPPRLTPWQSPPPLHPHRRPHRRPSSPGQTDHLELIQADCHIEGKKVKRKHNDLALWLPAIYRFTLTGVALGVAAGAAAWFAQPKVTPPPPGMRAEAIPENTLAFSSKR